MSVQVGEGIDAGAIWHYGDPFREQKQLAAGKAGVDLSHRPIFTISGPDRLRWLNDITSQDFANLAPGQPTVAYILSPQGHLNHVFGATDDGTTLWCHTEPGRLPELLAWLGKMIFAARVELGTPDGFVLAMAPGAAPSVIAADRLEATLGNVRAGTWAVDALRIEAGIPRIFVDTDERTIPNELANPDGDLLGPAVHLHKGCYPGQETVARVYNLGRPPRRLTRLLLDGSDDTLPPVGADVLSDGQVVGRMGSSQRHHELGPIGLALLKRQLNPDLELVVAGVAAAQEPLVSADAGLHWRPQPGLGRA